MQTSGLIAIVKTHIEPDNDSTGTKNESLDRVAILNGMTDREGHG